MVRFLWIAGLLAAGGGLAACGNSRTPVPTQSQLASPLTFRKVRLRAAGITLRAPLNWGIADDRRPLVNTLTFGTAVVAIWRYPRSGSATLDRAAIQTATKRLVRDSRAKDPGFRLLATHVRRVGGAPTVEIDALEQVGREARRVRSLHLFTRRAELVLDEYAPPASFAAIDGSVFSPLTRSVALTPVGST